MASFERTARRKSNPDFLWFEVREARRRFGWKPPMDLRDFTVRRLGASVLSAPWG